MTNLIAGNSPNSTARIAGFLYVLLIPLGVFGIMYLQTFLAVPGNISATIANIQADELMFRFSIVASMVIQLVHICLVLLFYKLLKPVSESVARVMVVLVLVGVPIAMLNEMNYGAVLFELAQHDPSERLIAMFIDLRSYGIQIVSIFWGLWLFPLGYLVFKSGFLPKIIGVLLMIGCFGYVVDSFIFFIDPDFGIEFAIYLFIGEVVIAFWLLIMGVDEKKRVQSSA